MTLSVIQMVSSKMKEHSSILGKAIFMAFDDWTLRYLNGKKYQHCKIAQ